MKKQIQISEYSADFIQRVTTALVGSDLNAYEIVWNLKEEQEGAQIVLQAKRADDAVITDSAQITGKEAKITLKNNIYCVPGLLTIRVQIVCGGSVLTQCQLICDVLEGYEETDIAADDRTPVLTSLIVQANEACANANAAAGRVPSTAELESLKLSVENKVDKVTGKDLSTNDLTDALKTRIEKAVQYKGKVSDKTSLPASAAKGDMYIVGGSAIDVVYQATTVTSQQSYDPVLYGFSDLYTLTTANEREQYEQAPSTGGGVDMCAVKVYNSSWEYITTVQDADYGDGPALWGMWYSIPEGLSENTTYYVVRADNQTPVATTPTHTMGISDLFIAVYDGAAWNLSPVAKDGKGLSKNDFTDELKTKLDGLSNYDDTAIKASMSALNTKVNNMGSLGKVAWSNVDNCTTPGTYLVTGKKDYDGTPGEGNSYSEYDSGYPILIVSNYTYYDNGQYNENGYRQVLYDANGKVMYRMNYTGISSWEDWSEIVPSLNIIQQSAISEVSSTVTTYTFNPKSYVSPSAAFKINHTGTNTVTFNFAAPSNTGYTNEILVYFKTALDNAVVWGSNVKFTDDEIPTIEAGVYYRIVAEYNPIMSKWVVGIINDGKGA